MSSLLQDLSNRRKSRGAGLLLLAAASFVVAATSTGCSEKTGSAFAPTSLNGGANGSQVQFHSTDTTVTATQGVPSGGFGGPRPGRGRHGGPPPESEDDVAEPAEGEVTGAEEL